jgi:hypothetical protein
VAERDWRGDGAGASIGPSRGRPPCRLPTEQSSELQSVRRGAGRLGGFGDVKGGVGEGDGHDLPPMGSRSLVKRPRAVSFF